MGSFIGTDLAEEAACSVLVNLNNYYDSIIMITYLSVIQQNLTLASYDYP